MEVNIKFLNQYAKVPTKGTPLSAGYDLYNPNGEYYIAPHETIKIDTKIAIELPKGTFGGIFPRSGLSTKKGLRLANCVGVIDSDYRGSIIVPIYNDSNEFQTIIDGERIAQLIVLPFMAIDFNIVNELNTTERGESGFGGTGRI